MEVGKVTPLHKDGPRNDRNNYRPISVLSVFSKIPVKHVARSFINSSFGIINCFINTSPLSEVTIQRR
jgi:hypothetical protein